MAISKSTSESSHVDQGGREARAFNRRHLLWLLAVVLTSIAIVVCFAWQAGLPPCGDQFNPRQGGLLCPFESNSQSRVVGKHGNRDFSGVAMSSDGQHGWVVGDGGTILATTDGGASWTAQASNSREDLKGIAMNADLQRGWVVGFGGTILATTDGGKNWSSQGSNPRDKLTGIAMSADGQRGWVVGDNGKILATTDGGKNWAPQASNSPDYLSGIAMSANSQRGWVPLVGGTILVTTDGGKSWVPQASNSNAALTGIAMSADSRRGWVVGDGGAILATSDAGLSWVSQASDSRANLHAVAMSRDGQYGWVVGRAGKILATTDSGKTWVPQVSNSNAALTGIAMSADSLRGWVVGRGGTILVTTDGGKSWVPQASDLRDNFNDVTMSADSQDGWVVGGSGTILTTNDGGKSWSPQTSNSREDLNGIAMSADGRSGWAVGDGGTILATTNGGKSWAPQASGSREDLEGIAMNADGRRGWVVGGGGTILATIDGGTSWAPQTSKSGDDFSGIAMSTDGQHGWAVGLSGTTLATTDGGQNWGPAAADAGEELTGIAIDADGRHCWIVGWEKNILMTVDGGKTWAVQASNSSELLMRIAMSPDGQRGWMVGKEGTIRATTNGGKNWVPQTSNSRELLNGIAMSANGQYSWVVGRDATILTTTDGGLHWKSIYMPYRRWPVPAFWWWLALALSGLLAGTVWARRRAGAGQPRRLADLILGRGDADAPITRADQDKLNFWPVVQALSLFMRHEKTMPPLTFAVTARWGRGKSSMMRMLQSQLDWQKQRTVWFNAWHHQQEPVVMAALLDAVIQQGTPALFSLQGLRFRTRLAWRRLKKQPFVLMAPFILWVSLAFVLPSILVWGDIQMTLAGRVGTPWGFQQIGDASQAALRALTDSDASEAVFGGEWSKFAGHALGAFDGDPAKLLGLLACVALGLAGYLMVAHLCRPFPARPGALLSSLGSRLSVSQAEEQAGFRQRFREHFADVTAAMRPAKLTIFVDDLDRCESNKAAETLEAINYLTDAGGCFVVLGIAREIVEAQLGEAYASLAKQVAAFERIAQRPFPSPEASADGAREPDADLDLVEQRRYSRRYLGKLIQIEVPVPEMSGQGLHALLMGDLAFEPSGNATTASDGDAVTGPSSTGNSRAQREHLTARKREERAQELRSQGRGLFAFAAGLALVASLVVQATAWYGERYAPSAKDQIVSRELKIQATQNALEQELAPYRRWLGEQVKVETLAVERGASAPERPEATSAKRPPSAPGATGTAARAQTHAASAIAKGNSSAVAAVPANVSSSASQPGLASSSVLTAATRDSTASVDAPRLRLANRAARLDMFEAVRDRVVALLEQQKGPKDRRQAEFDKDESANQKLLAEARTLAADDEFMALFPPVQANAASSPSAVAARASAAAASEAPNDVQDTTGVALGGPLLGIALVGVFGFFVLRDKVVVDDTQQFKDAMEKCQPILLHTRDLSAPREIKRFINRTRYLAMRARPRNYLGTKTGWLQRFLIGKAPQDGTPNLPISDTQLVMAGALYSCRPEGLPPDALPDWLRDPLPFLAESDLKIDESLKAAIRVAVTSLPEEQVPGSAISTSGADEATQMQSYVALVGMLQEVRT